MPGALKLLCGAFPQVVYLPGNHEYYSTTRQHVLDLLDAACARHTNLHWLRPGHPATIDGQRFIGGTMWFPRHPTAPKHALNDFRLIRDFEAWVYDENRDTVACLASATMPSDIVVTHHLPSARSTAPAYRGSVLNPFFVCDVEHVIRLRRPKLWLNGHTHTRCDYDIGETRVICNPLGYPHEPKMDFQPDLVLEVT